MGSCKFEKKTCYLLAKEIQKWKKTDQKCQSVHASVASRRRGGGGISRTLAPGPAIAHLAWAGVDFPVHFGRNFPDRRAVHASGLVHLSLPTYLPLTPTPRMWQKKCLRLFCIFFWPSNITFSQMPEAKFVGCSRDA